jgi:hypothetical protein
MQWLNSEQTRSRLATDTAAHVAVVDNKPAPRFPRNTIFDDVSEAIAKVRRCLLEYPADKASDTAGEDM